MNQCLRVEVKLMLEGSTPSRLESKPSSIRVATSKTHWCMIGLKVATTSSLLEIECSHIRETHVNLRIGISKLRVQVVTFVSGTQAFTRMLMLEVE